MPKQPTHQILMGDLSQAVFNDWASSSDLNSKIPAVKQDEDWVAKQVEIAKQFGSGPLGHSSLMNVVHDEVVFEIPVPPKEKREPVTAERAFKALMEKPGLAFGVLTLLLNSVLLGPWVTKGPTPFQGDYQDKLEGNGWPPKQNTWVRHRPDHRSSVTVNLLEDGYHTHGFIHPTEPEEAVLEGLFAGPGVGDACALMMIDEMLVKAGYRLV